MGCGQSKIHLYPRKSKSKANGKKGGHVDTEAEADEEDGHVEEREKDIGREREKNEDDVNQHDEKDSTDQANVEISVSLLRAKNLSLLQSQEISTSQQNFFRMLDQKIEEGPDYDSASETEIALEEARLNALVQHWESASLTASICSSASRSLQTTPVRQAMPIRSPQGAIVRSIVPNPLSQQPLSAELLPHSSLQSQQLPGGGLLMQTQPSTGQQNQQMLMSQMQMNPQLLHQMSHHQMAAVSSPQPQQQPQQLNHLLNVGGTSQPAVQIIGKSNLSPKRIIDSRTMINSTAHQTPLQLHQQQQQQQQQPQTYAIPSSPQAVISGGGIGVGGGGGHRQLRPTHIQMSYYEQSQSQTPPPPGATQTQMQTQQQQQTQPYFGDVLHPMQVPQAPPEYRFPPAISVQRLAPQVQRQLRETQELIKDSCPQLYAAGYGSPGPPLRAQPRNATRRPTLETQFSQELS